MQKLQTTIKKAFTPDNVPAELDQSIVNTSSLNIQLEQLRERLPVSVYSCISEISLYFEKTWSENRTLTIEDCLTMVDESMKPELFERLLEIDLSLGMERQAMIDMDVYIARFPQWASKIKSLFDQISHQSVYLNRNRVGKRIGNYLIQEILGRGGMGIVYKALDEPFQRTVAIKYLLPRWKQQPESLEQFINEITLLGRLKPGPPFVQAYWCDWDGDFLYLVMEYIEGIDLGTYVREKTRFRKNPGPLPYLQAVELILQAARGLREIHELGIIHRDIKPENLMIEASGQIRILDLGLGILRTSPSSVIHRLDSNSKLAQNMKLNNESTVRESWTENQKNYILGTPAYLSPEMLIDPGAIDPKSDIYSLGGTLFYLLTGEFPIRWYNPLKKIAAKQPPLKDFFQQINIYVPGDLLAILGKMLAVSPMHRCQSAEEVCQLLENFLDKYKPKPLFARLRTPFLLTGCVAFVSLLGAMGYYYHTANERMYHQAQTLVSQGQTEQAIVTAQNVQTKNFPEEQKKDFYLFIGELYQQAANDRNDAKYEQQAVAYFTKALEIEPENIRGLKHRAQVYLKTEEYDKAYKDSAQITKLSSKDLDAPIILGRIRVHQGDISGAIEFYSKVLKMSPNYADALFYRAVAYSKDLQLESAVKDFSSLLVVQPDHKQALLNRAVCLTGLNRLEDAKNDLDKLIALAPDNLAAHENRGKTWQQLGKWGRAVQDYRKTLDLDKSKSMPDSHRAEIFYQIAICSMNEGKLQDCIDACSAAISIQQYNASLFQLRGDAYQKLNQTENARRDFKKSFDLTSNQNKPPVGE